MAYFSDAMPAPHPNFDDRDFWNACAGQRLHAPSGRPGHARPPLARRVPARPAARPRRSRCRARGRSFLHPPHRDEGQRSHLRNRFRSRSRFRSVLPLHPRARRRRRGTSCRTLRWLRRCCWRRFRFRNRCRRPGCSRRFLRIQAEARTILPILQPAPRIDDVACGDIRRRM